MTPRTWFITGISSGFGRHLTELLLARGERVAGTVRDRAAVADIVSDRLWVAELDVTNLGEVRRVVDRAFADLGTIEVVVSNAGYGLFGAAEEATDEQMLHAISTNLLGSMQVIRAALPHLRAQGSGRILQLSSMAGQAALPGGSMYHAGKWGIEGFVDAVAREVAVFGIGCTIVEPGGARTNFRYGSSKLASRIAAYDASPASGIRKILDEGTLQSIGDPVAMAERMIACVDQTPAPRRLALGSDAYTAMHAQLTTRLAELETQKSTASSTDFANKDGDRSVAEALSAHVSR
jgi:NAD(P)-dependent dehydrogenase (short-subunit alcohol dehydrogenase family)